MKTLQLCTTKTKVNNCLYRVEVFLSHVNIQKQVVQDRCTQIVIQGPGLLPSCFSIMPVLSKMISYHIYIVHSRIEVLELKERRVWIFLIRTCFRSDTYYPYISVSKIYSHGHEWLRDKLGNEVYIIESCGQIKIKSSTTVEEGDSPMQKST